MALAKKKTAEEQQPHLQAVPEADPSHDASDDIHLPFTTHKKHEDSEGIWLMSYADMMTLLMGFFALIASFSKVDSTEFEKVKVEAVKYFGGEYETPYGDLAQKINSAIEEMGMAAMVDVQDKPEGVVLVFKGSTLFDSGAFEVKAAATPMMQELAKVVHDIAPSHKIVIEGHTDDVPISSGIILSNWELSGLRAARVALVFEEKGYQKPQITLRGWGETQPLSANKNPDGTPNPDNMAKNRRVTVTIQN
ncbi:MAG: flagellar motor protein MotB [Bdellovibrionaceae bacterium]|nr:flagellar motor protein MotB [Pseudobdellovibrionaceae bacterium]